MSTIIPFNPSPNANFKFSPVLDGTTYSAICTYNAYSGRYYLSIYTTLGALRLSLPIIASPVGYPINLTKGYFSTPIVFEEASNNFVIG
jgi:hypothetical protein